MTPSVSQDVTIQLLGEFRVRCGGRGVAQSSDYRFVAPHSELVKGRFPGVRVTAEDRPGNTVDSALPRAIPVG
ncbi:hypothetical protein [Streptomyces sp. NBC_00057]|uniref:hypothetical protein n=1 Tax=Streptomyces sp. NBC_00057 TaxID=2975634 RepID=UPI003255E403